MFTRYLAWGASALFALALAGFGLWIVALPSPAMVEARSVSREEVAGVLVALRPPKRERPLVAVVGLNDATEITDYLVPTGILRHANVADVVMLATERGPVRLYPTLTVLPDATTAEFDAANPTGADYVIVPAMSRDNDPAVLAWIREQASRGAIIVGVCAGAKVVGAAGLLAGRQATTHWYFVNEMRVRNPTARWVPDRRLVVDGGVVTTTGITASVPAMLMLIEAIAGPDRANAAAQDLGFESWDIGHASDRFRLTRPFALTVLGNSIRFWDRDRLGVVLEPGMDEVSLALVADAWSRTYRSRALTYAPSSAPVRSRHGVRLLPDRVAQTWTEADRVHVDSARPRFALDRALDEIGARYGQGTADAVAIQLEYPR